MLLSAVRQPLTVAKPILLPARESICKYATHECLRLRALQRRKDEFCTGEEEETLLNETSATHRAAPWSPQALPRLDCRRKSRGDSPGFHSPVLQLCFSSFLGVSQAHTRASTQASWHARALPFCLSLSFRKRRQIVVVNSSLSTEAPWICRRIVELYPSPDRRWKLTETTALLNSEISG